ncbi:hypothetical protein [Campylobacter sp. MG1]|uniref:hypothetical protein n=1 Tax=Campylobacter sp. MG1 TaxID=2976332 RepID=UPI00226C8F03|nr:hypothetical protein [Campylobacter sp. MG1]
MNNFFISLKDFFTFKFLIFSLAPLIASFTLFLSLFIYLINYINNINLNEEYFNFFLGAFVLQILHIAIMLFTIAGGGFLTLHLSVFFAIIIVSFLTPFIVKEINLKHYHYCKLDEVNFIYICWLLTKLFIKFLILLFFTMIFYIIPVLNLLAPILLFFVMFYLFFNFLIHDVASSVLNKNDFLSFNPFKIKYLTCIFLFYLICNIPYLGFFLPVFFVIFLSHLLFQNELNLKIQST